MWIRYQKSLLKCDIDEFESFVNNLYLKDETDKYSILLQEPINQNHEFILERAEMLYVESTIFEI